MNKINESKIKDLANLYLADASNEAMDRLIEDLPYIFIAKSDGIFWDLGKVNDIELIKEITEVAHGGVYHAWNPELENEDAIVDFYNMYEGFELNDIRKYREKVW